ncbi:MAG: hypothetical protein HW390_1738 [Candidatus Brocadiaceae bacterium]|nr:hypothetical protein [Candidatus Brocadiaceae bacterium]
MNKTLFSFDKFITFLLNWKIVLTTLQLKIMLISINKTLSIYVFAIFFALQRSVIAVDAAPHISDAMANAPEANPDRDRS